MGAAGARAGDGAAGATVGEGAGEVGFGAIAGRDSVALGVGDPGGTGRAAA
jgi:hypothetical protein